MRSKAMTMVYALSKKKRREYQINHLIHYNFVQIDDTDMAQCKDCGHKLKYNSTHRMEAHRASHTADAHKVAQLVVGSVWEVPRKSGLIRAYNRQTVKIEAKTDKGWKVRHVKGGRAFTISDPSKFFVKKES